MSTKLFTDGGDIFISFDVIPFDALVKLSVANWAEVDWVAIGLLQVVCSFHQALVPCAVRKTEHMAELVRSNFANSHQHGAFFLLWARVFFSGESLCKSMHALNSAERWNSVPEAVTAQLLRK